MQQNTYFAKKQLKEQERKNDQRRQTFLRISKYLIIAAAIAAVALGATALLKSGAPESSDQSNLFADQGREHIPVESSHPEYNSNPPSSGWHYANPAKTGFYETPLPDEQIVHNLEHGEIWIAYHPRVSDEVKQILKKYAGQYVIVTPREQNDFDVSLVAWTRVDSFNAENNLIDKQRIGDFIKRYDNKGPEKVRSGSMR